MLVIWCILYGHLVYIVWSFGVYCMVIWCIVNGHLVYIVWPFGVYCMVIWCIVYGYLVYIIPRRSRRDIVLAASVRLSVHSVRLHFLSVRNHISVPIGQIDSFLVQMISTMDSRYPISFVKINLLTLELLPLF